MNQMQTASPMSKETKAARAVINDVSDTALWVAYYRAEETERPDALFRDPYAKILVGDRGKLIADSMGQTSRFTKWSVIIRTLIIDKYLQDLIAGGVDTVINLGAGLDTRPYRMNLPSTLRWVEVDYPHMIDLKESKLKSEKPTCQLTRVRLDLADRPKRQQFFKEINATSKKAVILTEGVIPYLTPEQVTTLGEDLHVQSTFLFWITDYLAPQIYKYLQKSRQAKQMKNAPFVFYPPDWFAFFAGLGWGQKEIRYIAEVSEEVGRKSPMPWFILLIQKIFGKKRSAAYKKFSGYILFQKL